MTKRKISNTDKDDLDLLTKEEVNLKKPHLYKVILLNDDYTPMEYVVKLLMKVFNKSEPAAVQIMLAVHQQGSGICGVYTLEIAETKVKEVTEMAKTDEHPLKCIMEKE
tara:strand:- start:104 stop:430 length:327 start_codon:yes stop_codon:yes gene_type:complete